MQKNLFAPLGISTSYFGATPWHLERWRSNNYDVTREGTVVANGRDFDPGITIPNGGWNAPISDLVTWATFLTGAARDTVARSILRRETLASMWQPVVTAGDEAMGLSFFLSQRGTAQVIGHTGSQAGFRSFLYFSPDARTVVIGVVNTSNSAQAGRSQAGFRTWMKAGIDLLTVAR